MGKWLRYLPYLSDMSKRESRQTNPFLARVARCWVRGSCFDLMMVAFGRGNRIYPCCECRPCRCVVCRERYGDTLGLFTLKKKTCPNKHCVSFFFSLFFFLKLFRDFSFPHHQNWSSNSLTPTFIFMPTKFCVDSADGDGSPRSANQYFPPRAAKQNPDACKVSVCLVKADPNKQNV